MSLDMFSDYGSGGSSANSSSSWGSQEKVDWSPLQPQQRAVERPAKKATSFLDLVMGRCSLEDAMREFKLNGSDAPYCPEDEWTKKDNMAGIGPSGGYLRQTSWPAPEFTPSARLPRPAPVAAPTPAPVNPIAPAPAAAPELPSWLPFGSVEQGLEAAPSFPQGHVLSALSAEQRRVLGSLPDAALAALLRQLDLARAERRGRGLKMECRFCKNNGERESYYRSHWLKDARGRVACPVLRAHRCLRCGASGDQAHTDKYCPRASVDERMKSAAMMRSVRLASGRYRNRVPSGWNGENYVVFGETSPSAMQDNSIYNMYGGQAPLDPLWAALEQKLML